MLLLCVIAKTVVTISNFHSIEWDPKDNGGLNKGTGLSPKRSNPQGLGRPTVPAHFSNLISSFSNRQRSFSVYSSLTMRQGEGVRNYSSNSGSSLEKKSGLDLLSELRKDSEAFTNVYSLLLDEDVLIAAYKKVSKNKGAMTKGVDNVTLDKYSMDVIRKTIAQLKDHSFEFKPSRREYIPKANGKQRPLGITSPRDKIVQQVMVMILEAIYEGAVFLNSSHGFRPRRGCHTALKEVSKWMAID